MSIGLDGLARLGGVLLWAAVASGCASVPRHPELVNLEATNLVQVMTVFEKDVASVLQAVWPLAHVRQREIIEAAAREDKARDAYFRRLTEERLDALRALVEQRDKDLGAMEIDRRRLRAVRIVTTSTMRPIARIGHGGEIRIDHRVLYAAAFSALKMTFPMLALPARRGEAAGPSFGDPSVEFVPDPALDALVPQMHAFRVYEAAGLRAPAAKRFSFWVAKAKYFDLVFLEQVDFVVGHELAHAVLGDLEVIGEERSCEESRRLESRADEFSLRLIRPPGGLFAPPRLVPPAHTAGGVLSRLGALVGAIGGMLGDALLRQADGGVQLFMEHGHRVAGFASESSCSYDSFVDRLDVIRKLDWTLQGNMSCRRTALSPSLNGRLRGNERPVATLGQARELKSKEPIRSHRLLAR